MEWAQCGVRRDSRGEAKPFAPQACELTGAFGWPSSKDRLATTSSPEEPAVGWKPTEAYSRGHGVVRVVAQTKLLAALPFGQPLHEGSHRRPPDPWPCSGPSITMPPSQ